MKSKTANTKHKFIPSYAQTQVFKSKSLHLAINGVAGGGKTTLLEYLASQNSSATKSSLLVTYSVSAKDNLASRIAIDKVTIKTLHAFCFGLIRTFGHYLGYTEIKVSEAKQEKEIKELIQLHLERQQRHLPLSQINRLVDWIIAASKAHMPLEAWIARHQHTQRKYVALMAAVELEWQANKIKVGTLSFDDQLRQGYKLIKKFEEVREYISKHYSQILVDEFQDLSQQQMKIVRELSMLVRKTVVVGDDAQIVYGFCNDTRSNFHEFLSWYSDAEMLFLNESFRLTRPVADFANAIHYYVTGDKNKAIVASKPGPKPLWVHLRNQDQQDACLIAAIRQLNAKGIPYEQMAITARLHASLAETFRQLRQQGIPVRYGEEGKVSRMLDTLKSTLALIHGDYASADLTRILTGFMLDNTNANRSALRELRFKDTDDELQKLIEVIRSCRKLNCFEHQIKLIADRYAWIHKDNGKIMHRIHFRMIAAMARYCKDLDEITEMIDSHLVAQRQGIPLLTIHKIKGQEYQAVFVIDVMKGKLPHKRAVDVKSINEEWRLFYVALTRTMQYLVILSPSKIKQSSFLLELGTKSGLFRNKSY